MTARGWYPLWSVPELVAAIAKHEHVESRSHAVVLGELRDRVFAYLPEWRRARGRQR